jgi:long-chain acyl-CoA synthetase
MGGVHTKPQIIPCAAIGFGGEADGSQYFKAINVQDAVNPRTHSTFRDQPGSLTPLELLKISAERWPLADCTGERTVVSDDSAGHYRWMSYRDFYANCVALGRGLLELGVDRGDKVSICSKNCQSWMMAAFGAWSVGLVTVPIYESLTKDGIHAIITHSDSRVMICSESVYGDLLDFIDEVESIEHIIVMSDSIPQLRPSRASVVSLLSVLGIGVLSTQHNSSAGAHDLAMISYTSGSTLTDNPKGLLVTCENIVAIAATLSEINVTPSPGDTHLSFLPLADLHVFAAELGMFAHGARIGFARGGLTELADDMSTLRPTFLIEPPLMLTKLINTIISKEAIAPEWLQAILKWTPSLQNVVGRAYPGQPLNLLHVHGPNVRAAIACSPGVTLKLRSIPGMVAKASGIVDLSGELLLRGPVRFDGYYKQDDLTREVLITGWWTTGDLCKIHICRPLEIVGRVKHFVALRSNQWVSPAALTEAYSEADIATLVFVYAHADSDRIAAVVFPTESKLTEWRGKDLNRDREVGDAIRASLRKIADERNFRQCGRISSFIVEPCRPSIQNGLIGPKLKPRYSRLGSQFEPALRRVLGQIGDAHPSRPPTPCIELPKIDPPPAPRIWEMSTLAAIDPPRRLKIWDVSDLPPIDPSSTQTVPSKFALGIEFGSLDIRFGLYSSDCLAGNFEISHLNSRLGFEKDGTIRFGDATAPNFAPFPSPLPLLALKFRDPQTARIVQRFPLPVVEDRLSHNCVIDMGDGTRVKPEEILALHFHELKKAVTRLSGESVTDISIGVPTLFTSAQREAVRNAGIRAGLNVVHMISGTLLAARAIQKSRELCECGHAVMVYFGTSTLELSLVRVTSEMIREVRTVGSDRIGTDDLRDRIVDRYLPMLEEQGHISGRYARARLTRAVSLALEVEGEPLIALDDLETPFRVCLSASDLADACDPGIVLCES